MAEKREDNDHKVVLVDRKLLTISGVKKVNSFDPKEVVLDTVKGSLAIKGQDLGMKNLNLDETEIEIEGQIDVFHYQTGRSKEQSKGVWERIFK